MKTADITALAGSINRGAFPENLAPHSARVLADYIVQQQERLELARQFLETELRRLGDEMVMCSLESQLESAVDIVAYIEHHEAKMSPELREYIESGGERLAKEG